MATYVYVASASYNDRYQMHASKQSHYNDRHYITVL